MSTPPGANSEYSRGSEPPGRKLVRPEWAISGQPKGGPEGRRGDDSEGRGSITLIVVICAVIGALLVIVSQFTALYHVHSASSSAPLRTVGTGGNHAFAPIPLALLAVLFAYAVWRSENRPAMAAIALLGVVTLLIALLGDYPDAHASGLIGSSVSNYVQASSTPSAGLYMETLGAVLLLLAGGIGMLTVSERPRLGARRRATATATAPRDIAAPPSEDVPPAPAT
jgi:hypothetical protein